MAPEVKLFTLNGRDPFDTLWRGRAVIIGDAAHPMAPTHAQSGVLALEEAAALEILFKGVTDLKTIQTTLEAYSKHMRPLAARAQILSSYPVHTNAEAMGKLRAVYTGPIPDVDLSFDRSYKDLFYSHNIVNEMNELREKLDKITSSQTSLPLDSAKSSAAVVAVEELPIPRSDKSFTLAEPAQTEQSLTELAARISRAAAVIESDLTRTGARQPSLLDDNGPTALPLAPNIQAAKLELQAALLDLNLLVTGPNEFFLANCLQVSFSYLILNQHFDRPLYP